MIIDLLGHFFFWPIIYESWFSALVVLLPLIGIFGHMVLNFGKFYAFIFVLLSSGIGFLAEWIGLNFGLTFGGGYFYQNMLGPDIFGVPLLVIIYWSVFIYTGYGLIDFIWPWKIEKRFLISKSFERAFFTAIAVITIDLIMDPLLVLLGKWSWPEGGIYFGIPWQNFRGWFLVSFFAIFLFEFFNKKKQQRFFTVRDFIPASGYCLIIFSFSLLALSQQLYLPTLIGVLVSLPWIILAISKIKKRPPRVF
jgi:putative membrane protein